MGAPTRQDTWFFLSFLFKLEEGKPLLSGNDQRIMHKAFGGAHGPPSSFHHAMGHSSAKTPHNHEVWSPGRSGEIFALEIGWAHNLQTTLPFPTQMSYVLNEAGKIVCKQSVTGDLLPRLRQEKTNTLIIAFSNFSVVHLMKVNAFSCVSAWSPWVKNDVQDLQLSAKYNMLFSTRLQLWSFCSFARNQVISPPPLPCTFFFWC